MSTPKSRIPGPRELGRLLDERQARSHGTIELRHDNGTFPVPPAGAAGLGDLGAELPTFPEQFVTSLQKSPGGTGRSGAVRLLEQSDSTLRIEDVSDGEAAGFRFSAVSLLAVEELPEPGGSDIIYKRISDNTLWWDRSGAGDWTQLDANGLDRLVKVNSEDSTSSFLADKIVAGPGINIDILDHAGQKSLEISSLFQLEGNQISPQQSSHSLIIGAAGDATAVSVFSENGSALLAEASGSGTAISAVANEGYGGDFASTDSHAIRASTGAVSAFSIFANECSYLGAFSDIAEMAVPPAAPASSRQRLFASQAGRLFMKHSSGAEHDLCICQSQSFPASSGRSGTPASHLMLDWTSAAFPPAASAAAVSASGNNSSFSMPVTAGYATMGESYGRLEWTSSSTSPGLITTGAQVALGQSFRRNGGSLLMRCRLRINNKDRFNRVELAVCDAGSSSSGSGNLLSGLNAAAWTEVEFGPLDVSEWQTPLRLLLCAQGTTDAGKSGLTQIDIEYLEVRTWAA